jgi:arsenate reductase
VSDAQGNMVGEAFSKVFDSPPNPSSGFIAVMTCSSADAQCPVIAGCSDRIVLTYDDPKQHDGTAGEAKAYTERCRQIGREMLYVFAKIAG